MLISWQVKAIAAGLLILAIFGAGWKTRDAFCDAAAAKQELAAMTVARDDALEQVRRHQANSDDVRKRLERRAETESELNKKVAEYETELAKMRDTPGCRVTSDDLKRLQRIQ